MGSRPSPLAPALMLSGAVLALVGARLSELLPGVVPCPLCLLQRWPWRAALLLALLALLALCLPPRPFAGVARKALLAGGFLCLAAGAGMAGLHVGVEQGWWPSPLPACGVAALRAGASIEDMLAALPALPARPCDEPTLLVPSLPLSMAGMNLTWTALVALACALALGRERLRHSPR